MTQRGRWVTAVSGDGVGFPDIFALRGNRRLMVELKSTKGKPTTEQEKWLEMARQADIEVYIWRPQDIDQIEQILK
jgi:Holliday junction resolvase